MDQKCSETFDTIILSSGGLKGLAQLGVLTRYSISSYLDNITHWVGVSVGSLISLLILCGYSTLDIYHIDIQIFKIWMMKLQLCDIPTQGIIRINYMREFLHKLIYTKTGLHNPSFLQLYNFCKNKRLTVVSCILQDSASSICYHNVSNTPNESVIDGVIASCSIPLVMEKCIISNQIHVDGGLACAFPIEYVDDGKTKILGIYVESKIDTHTHMGYVFGILDIGKHIDFVRQKRNASKNVTIIEIYCDDINPLEYEKQKQELFLIGWKEANEIIEKSS